EGGASASPLPAAPDAIGATGTAAAHGEAAGVPLASAHPGGSDTPAAPAFDALLHAAGASAPLPDGPRAVPVGTTASAPAPLAQPADPRAGYGDEFGGNLVWMAEQRLGHAQLHVSPDHLGPIEVRLQLEGSQVHASFLSAQPEVRHALEASLPRLRELLGEHGLQLAQADVGQRQHDGRALPMQQPEADGRDPLDDGLAPTLPTRIRAARGLLDEYA
ncbi:MAG: flagellar hook-length control protein FliK, partial [Lysobacteraceae bacterium]